MATKDKDKKGPSTQRTGTAGVNAVGVNHGMTRQEAVKPTPQQAMAQLSQTVAPQQPPQVNYAPGFTDVAGSPSYQQHSGQQVQQAPVVAQPVQQAQQVGPQQTPPQTVTNGQQNPANSPAPTTPAAASVQPVQQQQFAIPQQIALPNGQTITLQQPQQPPTTQQVRIGNAVVDVPVGPTQTAAPAAQQQPAEKSAAQQNAEYERQKAYNQAVDEYLKAGVSYNAVRPHGDTLSQTYSPEDRQKLDNAQAKAKEQTDAEAKKRANGEDDEYVKTLKEYLDSKYESPEDKEAREKREARQRRFAAISEGLANVFNVGGAVAGAQPAQWKSGVGELYANQEAEAGKQRLEYREALKDMITYRNAVRNGDIAQARAIEEKRKNDWLEYKMLHDQENKAAEQELKKRKQDADAKRADKLADARIRDYEDKHEINEQKKNGTYQASKNVPKKSSGRGSKSTGKQAERSANASRKRVTKNRLQNLKNKNK
jgi:hypothetical protein